MKQKHIDFELSENGCWYDMVGNRDLSFCSDTFCRYLDVPGYRYQLTVTIGTRKRKGATPVVFFKKHLSSSVRVRRFGDLGVSEYILMDSSEWMRDNLTGFALDKTYWVSAS